MARPPRPGQVPAAAGVSPNAKGGSKPMPGTRTGDRWWSLVLVLADSIVGERVVNSHQALLLLLAEFQGVSPPSGLLRCRQLSSLQFNPPSLLSSVCSLTVSCSSRWLELVPCPSSQNRQHPRQLTTAQF